MQAAPSHAITISSCCAVMGCSLGRGRRFPLCFAKLAALATLRGCHLCLFLLPESLSHHRARRLLRCPGRRLEPRPRQSAAVGQGTGHHLDYCDRTRAVCNAIFLDVKVVFVQGATSKRHVGCDRQSVDKPGARHVLLSDMSDGERR